MAKLPKSELKELDDSCRKFGSTLEYTYTTDLTQGDTLFEVTCTFTKSRDGRAFTGKGKARAKKQAENSASQQVLELIKESEIRIQPNVSNLRSLMTRASISPIRIESPSRIPISPPYPDQLPLSPIANGSILFNNGETYNVIPAYPVTPPQGTVTPVRSDPPMARVIAEEGIYNELDTDKVLEEATVGNKIGELQEFCAKNNLPSPMYIEERIKGAENIERFKALCSVGQIKAYGVAMIKRISAKKIAAWKVLQRLEDDLKTFRSPFIVSEPEPKIHSNIQPPEIPKETQVRTMVTGEPNYYPNIGIGEGGSAKIVKFVTEKIVYFANVQIGQGGTAKVYEGYFENPTRKAAVKICRKEIIHHEKNKELDIMRKLNHPNVVTYFITEDIDNDTYIVMELADRTLNDVIKVDKNIGPQLLKKFCTDITTGLTALHKLKIIHRDLKPSNVLIFGNVAKLADFGISKELDFFTQGVVTEAGKGTPIWMPPEGLKAIGSTIPFRLVPSFDIFSLGLTIHYAMTRGSHPFDFTGSDHLVQIQSNIFKSKPNWSWISANEFTALKNLLQSMISTDTGRRPSSSCALEHPFFWDDKKSLEFIFCVSNDLKNSKSKASSNCRTEMEEMYKRYCNQMPKQSLSWKSRLCVELQEFMNYNDVMRSQKKGNRLWKSYTDTVLLKLIEFIRDQDQHCENWDNLEHVYLKGRDVFGPDGLSYGPYFLRTFPELTTLLYTLFQNVGYHGLKLPEFYKLNVSTYFEGW